MSAAALTTPSVRPFGNFQSPKQRRDREERDNCDYCEFSGARNYVNEVEKRERKERVEAWKYCNVRLSESSVHANQEFHQ